MDHKYVLFPFRQVKKDENIIIYGAGIVGKNFYAQVKNLNYCEVLFFVDKNFDKINLYCIEVKVPAEIGNCQEYDHVVVASTNEKVKQEIFNELVNCYHVPEDKVIIPNNNVIDWHYGFSDLEVANTFAKEYPNYLELVSPEKMVSSKRMDIVIRYLLFKDFINEHENPENLSLFTRYTMTKTGGGRSKFTSFCISEAECVGLCGTG